MPEPDYPRIAYEAWGRALGWILYDVKISQWDRLSQEEKLAWEAAIDAAFNAQIPGDAP
jgi:hypothetical protein